MSKSLLLLGLTSRERYVTMGFFSSIIPFVLFRLNKKDSSYSDTQFDIFTDSQIGKFIEYDERTVR